MSKELLEETLMKLIGENVHIRAGKGNLRITVYGKLVYEGNDIYSAGNMSTDYAKFPLGSVLEIRDDNIAIAL